MAEKRNTIDLLACSLDGHRAEMETGPGELVDLVCALVDQAASRAGVPGASAQPPTRAG